MNPTSSNSRKSYRAPMLWLLLPWCSGLWLASADRADSLSVLSLLVGSGLLLVGASVFLLERFSGYFWIWKSCYAVAAGLLAMAWWHVQGPDPAAARHWRSLPVRECELVLRVDSIASHPRVSGHPVLECRANVVAVRSPDPELLEPMPEELNCHLTLPPERGELREFGILRARAVLHPPKQAGMPFLFRNGEVLEVIEAGRSSWDASLRYTILHRMILALGKGEPKGFAYAGYLQSMLTGDTRFLAYPDKERIRRAGVMHFFAISGFHLSMIALICYTTLQLVGASKRVSIVAMLAFCAGFVWVTGNPVSAQRAWLMLACYFFAKLVLRKPDALASTAAAALCVLWMDPTQLFSPGFQLSFIVVAGILTQAIPLHERLVDSPFLSVGDAFRVTDRITNGLWKLRRFFLGAFSVSWTAFWMSAPVVASTFGSVPFAAIIVNTLLVPLFALILITGFLSASLGVLGMWEVSGFLNQAAWLVLASIDALLAITDRLPLTLVMEMPGALAAVATLAVLGVGCGWNLFRRQHHAKLFLPPLISLGSLLLSLLLPRG
ncbi:MAG: ComEC/Rec2 family competence protein [Puniceicoccaceae bacterium]